MFGLLSKEINDIGYEGDEWSIVDRPGLEPILPQSESVFSVGNGFIGVRGGLEEQVKPNARPGDSTYLNGVFEEVPIAYHESGHGFADSSDQRIPVADPIGLFIRINGETFGLEQGKIISSYRELNFLTGLLTREVRWCSPKGDTVNIILERIAYLPIENILASRVTIEAVDFSGDVEVESFLNAWFDGPERVTQQPDSGEDQVYDPRVAEALAESPWQVEEVYAADDVAGFVHQTVKSQYRVATLLCHQCDASQVSGGKLSEDSGLISGTYAFSVDQGESVSVTKWVSYGTDRRDPDRDALKEALDALKEVKKEGFDAIKAKQEEYLGEFWLGARLHIEGDETVQKASRFNMFQLLQAAARDDYTSVAAKGQTGEGYEGHFFWDAEIYALPFLAYNQPLLAKNLVAYRYRMLDRAREIARTMGHSSGALFAWRTIGGKESSAYFPAGTAQYHINADVAYATQNYVEVTGDQQFLVDCGAEVIFETARIWMHVGFFNDNMNGQFCINTVTGPDEYTALVNNNFYTNVMVRAHLEYAVKISAWLDQDHNFQYRSLAKKIGLQESEIKLWKQAAEQMFLPYDSDKKIFAQDDSFLNKAVWDFENTPADKYPLLLHYHMLTIYRYQVCKQADTVLALVLQGQCFEEQDKRRSFEYYEGVTVHDSTLSPSAFGILAAELGEHKKAYSYLQKSALIDLEDLHGNSDHGLHLASMAGGWMVLFHGFLGAHNTAGKLHINPNLPERWGKLSMRIRYQGRIVEISANRARVTLCLIAGEPLDIDYRGTSLMVDTEKEVSLDY